MKKVQNLLDAIFLKDILVPDYFIPEYFDPASLKDIPLSEFMIDDLDDDERSVDTNAATCGLPPLPLPPLPLLGEMKVKDIETCTNSATLQAILNDTWHPPQIQGDMLEQIEYRHNWFFLSVHRNNVKKIALKRLEQIDDLSALLF